MPVNLTAAAARSAADWLSQRRFTATAVEGATGHEAQVALDGWLDGFRRAISVLRDFADVNTPIPDDISELDQ